MVLTDVHTPRFCGELMSVALFLRELKPFCKAGAVDFFSKVSLPLRTNWLNVGNIFTSLLNIII